MTIWAMATRIAAAPSLLKKSFAGKNLIARRWIDVSITALVASSLM
jgi:hypothetical protein